MASDPPQTLPFVAKARGREAEAADDEDDISTTVAAESTPLLRSSSATSVTGSSRTVRTVRSADHCQGPRLLDGQAEATTPLLATSPPRPSPSAAASEKLSAPRIVLICASVWLLIFLQAANMSGMTMTQSSVALELRASGGEAVWFTSTYLIAGSSLSPLGGRLAAIFGPVSMVLPCVGAFALGGMLSGGAPSVAWFLVGRCLTGVGAAGIMTLSVILVLALSPESRRGVFIGLVNLGFTIGLSFGAVVFGAVEPLIGWVCFVCLHQMIRWYTPYCRGICVNPC